MNIVLRAAAGYFILLFAVRLIGRRTASRMAPFDLVLLFLFGGITIGAVVGEDHSLVGAISAVFTIGLMHILVSLRSMPRRSSCLNTVGGTGANACAASDRPGCDGRSAAARRRTAGTGPLCGRRARRKNCHYRKQRPIKSVLSISHSGGKDALYLYPRRLSCVQFRIAERRLSVDSSAFPFPRPVLPRYHRLIKPRERAKMKAGATLR
jgi:hypothetical protein